MKKFIYMFIIFKIREGMPKHDEGVLKQIAWVFFIESRTYKQTYRITTAKQKRYAIIILDRGTNVRIEERCTNVVQFIFLIMCLIYQILFFVLLNPKTNLKRWTL